MDSNKFGCVYEIRCLQNNCVYYGQTIDFSRRIKEHINKLKLNLHSNHYMQEDFNKYGIDNFSFKIIEGSLNLQERRNRENYWINYYGGIESNNVYNYQDNVHENLEMRSLVSEHQKGKTINPSAIEKMRKSLTGRKLSEEHIQHIKEGCSKFIGDLNPARRPEVRKKISEKVSGSGNGMFGKHHSNEAKERIRQARLGKSPANKGKHVSEETKAKISSSLKKLKRVPYNKGKSKYSKEFIEQLRFEYSEFKSYRKVQELHKNICYDVIVSLIKNGKSSK